MLQKKMLEESLRPSRVRDSTIVLGHLFVLALTTVCHAQTDPARMILNRAVADFEKGRIAESVAGFDRVVSLAPETEPHLWQRGIALYYAGRYEDCRAQFESHRTVNPNDVENAAWHFLCVSRSESPARAKALLLPVGPDSRVPMSQIYQMFAGRLSAEEVLTAGGTEPSSQFYAELYVGLYLEALGQTRRGLKHIRNACADRYATAGYMQTVARVHLDLATKRANSTRQR